MYHFYLDKFFLLKKNSVKMEVCLEKKEKKKYIKYVYRKLNSRNHTETCYATL